MALYPENLAQLQEIIKSAGESKTPLVALSSAPPHIHGISENPSAETVSFQKMNRILKIDRPGRYIRMEAGVTFDELIPEAKKLGLRLNHPFLPRAGKSVAASLLEKAGGIVSKYQYDYHDPLLNAEVVYGTGDVFRTGSAAGPGPFAELTADKVCPWGPGTIDFIRFLCGAQGTMGFVTWVTMKAELLPTMSRLFFIASDDVSKLTSLAAELLFRRIPDECVILNHVNFAAAFGKDPEEEKRLTESCPPWVLLCRICGYERWPEERVKIYSGYLEDNCRERELIPEPAPVWLSGKEEEIESRLTDCDRFETYWKCKAGGLYEFVYLSPPSKTPRHIQTIMNAEDIARDKLGLTIIPQVQGRAFRTECDLYCDNTNPDAKQRIKAAGYRLEEQLFGEGAFFDRPYGQIARKVFEADHEGTEAMKKLKNIFDPDHILNPGKLFF